MNRSILVIALLLSGCGVNWRPSKGDKPQPPADVVTVADPAEAAGREKFRLMAINYRLNATKTRAGEFKAFNDSEEFMSPLNEVSE